MMADVQHERTSDTSPGGRVEACDVHFRFGDRDILRGVSLSLDVGEVVSLLGANGAGKTTLLRVLLGLASPAHGEVVVGGSSLASLSSRQTATRIAYVPQVHLTPFPYTVREVVTMGRLPRNGLLSRPSRIDRDVVERVLEKLEISRLADRVYSEISGGERQLALIARALAQETPTLILDEPFANLDFGYQTVVARHLKELAKEGHAILMTGHDPQFAFQASSRIALLVDGRIESDGPPAQVLTSAAIRSLYGVDVECIPFDGGRIAFFPR